MQSYELDNCSRCELFYTISCEKTVTAWMEAKARFLLSGFEDQLNRMTFMKEKFKDCSDFIETERPYFHRAEK